MSNQKAFEEITNAIIKDSPFRSTEELTAFYIGCLEQHLAQTVDVINDIKRAIKED